MDPHYWPSLYPGIGIGILLGFAVGGWLPVLVGGVGGLAGAAVALGLGQQFGVDEGFISLAVLVACSATGAKLLIVLIDLLQRRLSRQNT